MSKPRPRHYKVPRPASDDNLPWDAVALMWEHANFYDDEATYRQSIAPATLGQLAIYACGWYLNEVHNGGHDQFFRNSTGMVWRDALDGFRLIGADAYTAVLAEALKHFPNSQPSIDHETRDSQTAAVPPGSFQPLDDRIYALEDAFHICATQYIQAHPDQFFTPPTP